MNAQTETMIDLVNKLAQLNEILLEDFDPYSDTATVCYNLEQFIEKLRTGGLVEEVPEIMKVTEKIAKLCNTCLELQISLEHLGY
jgi:hypothetical protein